MVNVLQPALETYWSGLKIWAGWTWSILEPALKKDWEGLKPFADWSWNSVFKPAMESDWEGLKDLASWTWDHFKSALKTDWAALKDVCTWIWNQFKADFEAVFTSGALGDLGKSIVDGITNGIEGEASSLLSSVGNLGSSVLSAFGNAIGSASPSKLFALEGQNIIAGLQLGITQATPLAAATIQSSALSLTHALPNPISGGGAGAGGGSVINLYVSGNTIMDSNDITKLTNAISSKLASFIIPSSGLRPVAR